MSSNFLSEKLTFLTTFVSFLNSKCLAFLQQSCSLEQPIALVKTSLYCILNVKKKKMKAFKTTKKKKLYFIFLKKRILWNISFRPFHETQFNAYFITFNLISWNSYKICKKKTSTKHHKKENALSRCLPRLHVVDIGWPVSHGKVILTGDCFFQYFTRDKNGFVHYRIQVISSNKYIQNWYTLQDIQIFDRTSQSTKQIIIDSYSLTIKRKSVIFSGSRQIPQRNTILSQENM